MAYASVRYLRDGHKKNVPVTFIKDFDTKTNEFDPRKTYLVFWSNDPDDTPQEALKRQQTIPVVVKEDADSEETAYYPATISTIKDSLDALLRSDKRIPVVSQKLVRDLSMDFESSSSHKETRKNQGASNNKSQSKAKTESKPKAKTEPSSNSAKAKTEPRTSSAVCKKSKNLDNANYILGTSHGSGEKITTSGPRKRHTTDSNAADAKKRKLLEDDLKLSTESSEELDSKDPPFSPKKLIFLKQEVVILQSGKKRLMNLNLKMQERLCQIEDKHSKCEEKLANAARFCSNCQRDLSPAKLVDSKKVLSSRKTQASPAVIETGPEDGISVNENEEINPMDYCVTALSPLPAASAALPDNGQDEMTKKAEEERNTEAGNDGIISDASEGKSACKSNASKRETVFVDAVEQQMFKKEDDFNSLFDEAYDLIGLTMNEQPIPKPKKGSAASRNDTEKGSTEGGEVDAIAIISEETTPKSPAEDRKKTVASNDAGTQQLKISTKSKSPIQVSKKEDCKAAAKQEIGNDELEVDRIFGKEEPYILSDGKVIPGKNMKILWDAVTGKAGDSMFIKNVCETFFGRNTLADSRVKGIKRSKKTEDEEETGFGELPSLDPNVLGDVKKMLAIRLTKEKECLIGNPRLKDAVINRIITDKIKALRNAGYGLKVQPLLMAKRQKKSASKAEESGQEQ